MRDGDTHILFDIAGRSFALPAAQVAEVLPLPELSEPPGLPEAVAGLLDFGGDIVSVLRADRLLGLCAGDPGPYAHILLMRGEPARLALLVDRVAAVRRVQADDRRPVADSETFRGSVIGEITIADGRAHLLSLERLLSEAERRRVAAYGEAEARRRAVLEKPP